MEYHSKQKKKIKLNMFDLGKKHHKRIKTQTYQSCPQKDQFDKLLDITSRCVDYYNKFVEEKQSQLDIMSITFKTITQNLNQAFNGIIEEIKAKHMEILNFVSTKQLELKNIKQTQQSSLKQTLEEVKSVHLKNLLQTHQQGESSLSTQLSGYAQTLYKFYSVIEEVQKINFKQNVEESLSFINNLIMQEIKVIVCERIPQKSTNYSFSVNDSRLWETVAKGKESEDVGAIILQQECRSQNIKKYEVHIL